MNQSLRDVRVLIADDQRDVAATLTDPLKTGGATRHFVVSGTDAIDQIRRGGFDLLVLDLKMPPGHWGGLWTLERMQEGRIQVPTLMLSGEGSRQQLIQARRLGSEDWIDKDNASAEIEERVAELLGRRREQALEAWKATAPTPLAQRLGLYGNALGTEKEFVQGRRLLEGIVRFASLVGLATLDPASAGPLQGNLASRISAPSFGTWWDVFQQLAKASVSSPSPSAFAVLARCIAFSKQERQRISNVVALRNDEEHGDRDASQAEHEELRTLLTAIAHRVNTAWPWRIESTAKMTWSGKVFTLETLQHVGPGVARRSQLQSELPIQSGVPFLVGPTGVQGELAPWIHEREGNLLLMDGIKDGTLKYADVVQGARGLTVTTASGRVTRSDIAPWIPRAQHQLTPPR